jgi:hypothetical protein
MKTIESFPQLINDIFGELEMASQISIDCIASSDTCLETDDAIIRVVAVNGMRTPRRFLRRMKCLKNEVHAKFQEIFGMIDPGNQDTFVDLALCRAEKIAQTVMFTRSSGPEEWITQSVCWAPGQVHCYIEDVEFSDSFRIAEAVLLTRQYAWHYYTEIYRVEELISSYASDTINQPIGEQEEYENTVQHNLMLNWPIPVVCVLMRALYDTNRLENFTLSEISHWISENFFTSSDERLDPEVILDLLENPSQEAMDELKVKLDEIEKCIKKFLRQQRRQFKMASAYARTLLADPERSAVLATRVKPGRSILRLAIQEYIENNPF